MELRELKKEAEKLPNVVFDLKEFKENWIKPISSNTNKEISYINSIPEKTKEEINLKLHQLKNNLAEIHYSQSINEKINHYARNLIEMKLTTFNGNHEKAGLLTNMMLNDDYLKFQNAIDDIKTFEKNLTILKTQYEEINELLQKHLSLDETLHFLELPHQKYLYNLIQTAQKQKRILPHLGRHFVSLVKETTPLKKKAQERGK
tara:strand:- start:277 stop:888 length:612 start_codon:yes stop_codon:yes gene_type:complete